MSNEHERAVMTGATGNTDGELMTPSAAIEAVRAAVTSWDQVTTHDHRFGGLEFRFGRRELGHLHRSIADLPFPRRERDELVAAGRARPHHVLPDSGWITVPMRTAADVANVIALFQRNYERAVRVRASADVEAGSLPSANSEESTSVRNTNGIILVTGATGNVGRHIVSELASSGAAVRALTRNPASNGSLPDGIDVVRGDLTDPITLEKHLDGVDSVFLMWPFFTADGAAAIVDAIARHARRIVFLSAIGVRDDVGEEADAIFHGTIERLIERSGLAWTFLRAGGFATNTLWWAPQIRTDGIVRAPYGAAARSLIHERDIASVAVRALTDDAHRHAKYLLTGPRAVTQIEQVHAIGDAIGRSLRFEEIPRDVARQHMIGGGMPPSFADGALDYWATLVTEAEPVTSAVEAVTGAPARSFRDWATDHASDFR